MKWLILIALVLCASLDAADRRTIMRGYRAAGAASPVPDIAWWKFSENSGTNVADSSSRGTNNLTLFSASMWGAGKTGTGIKGNGSSWYAYTSNTLNAAANKVTVAFWINSSSWSGTEIITELSANAAANNNSFLIYDDGGSVFHGFITSTGFREETSGLPSTSAWHHYAVVLDNSTNTGDVKTYLDASLQSETVNSNSKSANGNYAVFTFYVFARAGTSFFSNNATIDDLRIYSGELSAGDVTAVYNDPQ